MSSHDRSPLWPPFWHDVPEADRAPIRDVLAELLGHGVILGTEGSGRDLFLLIRDLFLFLSPLPVCRASVQLITLFVRGIPFTSSKCSSSSFSRLFSS